MARDHGIGIGSVKRIVIEELGEEKFRKEFPAKEKVSNEKKEAIINEIRSGNHGSLRSMAKDHGVYRQFVKKIATEVLGEEKFRKEFPAKEKVSDEKKEAIINEIRSGNHGALTSMARDHRIDIRSVKRIIIEELGEEKFRKEFPAQEKVPDEKIGAIKEDVISKNHGSLTSMARDHGVSRTLVKKIATEVLGEEKFRKEFPSNEKVSDEKKEAIINVIRSGNYGSLRSMARDHGVSRKLVKKIATEVLGEKKIIKEFPAKEKVSDEKKGAIKEEIRSKNHSSLKSMARDYKIAKGTVEKIVIEELGEEKFRKEFPAGEKVSDEKRRAIIKDVKSENHGTLENIARDQEVGFGVVRNIAFIVLGDDKFKKEFPSDIPAKIGTITHACINELISKDFDERRENSPDVPKIYSEPKIYHPASQKHADMGFLNDTSYLKDILTDPTSGKILSQELKIDQKKLDQIKFVQFDYTNQLNMDNIMDKIQKYQHPEIMTFIVGTKWSKHWEGRTMDLPVDDRIKYPENIKIINDECFADLMKLKGNYKDKFEEIIDLNKKGDLDSLEEIHEVHSENLHKTGELKEDLRKKGYIKKDMNEYIHNLKIEQEPEGTLDQFIYNENNIKKQEEGMEFKGVLEEIKVQKEDKEFEGVLEEIKEQKEENEFEGVLDEITEEKGEIKNGDVSDGDIEDREEDEHISDGDVKDIREENGEDVSDNNYENY